MKYLYIYVFYSLIWLNYFFSFFIYRYESTHYYILSILYAFIIGASFVFMNFIFRIKFIYSLCILIFYIASIIIFKKLLPYYVSRIFSDEIIGLLIGYALIYGLFFGFKLLVTIFKQSKKYINKYHKNEK